MRILLDAGHGAGSSHNRGSLIGNEGDNNFYYSLELKKALELYKGVEIKLTRNKITDDPSLSTRGTMGNGFDLFLSLHSNAIHDSSVNGVELYDSVRRPCKTLATKLVNDISKMFRTNRGIKYKQLDDNPREDYFGVLRAGTAKCAMLIEYGFHTNKEDVNVYANQRAELARVTSKVIAEHYGLSKNDKPTAPVKPVAPKPQPPKNNIVSEVGNELKLNADVYERNNPTTKDNSGLKLRKKGEVLQYNAYLIDGGYNWIRLISGKWLPWRETDGEKWGVINEIKKVPPKNKPSGAWKREDGVFILSEGVYERNEPNTSNKSGTKLVPKGSKIAYDAYLIQGGYVWLRKVHDGKVIPWRVHNGETWGKVV